MISATIQRFVAHAERIEAGPLLDPRSRWTYIILGFWLSACLAGFAFSDFVIGSSTFVMLFLGFCWLVVCALLARRYGHPRVALFLETLAIPGMIGGIGVASVIFMASLSGPFVDERLIKLDAFFYFDWRNVFHFYLAHPWIVPMSGKAYAAFTPQLIFIPMAVYLWRRDAVWPYMTAYLLSLALTLAIFPFVPAVGPYVYYGIPHGVLKGVGDILPWQWHFGEQIAQLRNGAVRDMSKLYGGLVQMPSFHAATAILYVWAAHGIKYLRWPVLAINVAMILSTFVSGAHYLSDLLGGSGVAIISIWIGKLLTASEPDLRAQSGFA